jgi:hypothetical protein
MDGRRFDRLVATLNRDDSRRRLLRLFGGGAAASLLGVLGIRNADAACAHLGGKCGGGKKCCAEARCRGGRCKCAAGKKKCGKGCIDANACCTHKPLESLVVPADGVPVTATLANPERFHLYRASGTTGNGLTRCDADFCFDPADPADHFDRCGNNPAGSELGVLIGGRPGNWGNFREDHVYEQKIAFTFGNNPTFSFGDCDFSDNAGEIRIDIFPCE